MFESFKILRLSILLVFTLELKPYTESSSGASESVLHVAEASAAVLDPKHDPRHQLIF